MAQIISDPKIGRLKVEVEVQGRKAEALVDTGAQVSVLSQGLFDSLTFKPTVNQACCQLGLASSQGSMVGKLCEAVNIKVGSSCMEHPFYVAEIASEVILGMDFLGRIKAHIDCSQGVVKMVQSATNADNAVTTAGKTVIPGNTARLLKVILPKNGQAGVIEPEGLENGLLTSRVFVAGDNYAHICIINLGEGAEIINSGTVVGRYETEVELVFPNKTTSGGSYVESRTIQEQLKLGSPHIYHLEDSRDKLNPDQQNQLAMLLFKFQEVFAKHDWDLGKFTAIKHEINTGYAPPVQEKLRRTPKAFYAEEKKMLDNLLQADCMNHRHPSGLQHQF